MFAFMFGLGIAELVVLTIIALALFVVVPVLLILVLSPARRSQQMRYSADQTALEELRAEVARLRAEVERLKKGSSSEGITTEIKQS